MYKKTYETLGESASFEYPNYDYGQVKTMVISDTLLTLDASSGDTNNLKNMLYVIDDIGDDILDLDDGCFQNCDKLTHINSLGTIESIGNNAFKNCTQLSSFKNDTFYIPMTTGDNIFENCDFRNLSIDQTSSNTRNVEFIIGEKTFANNKNLSSVYLNDLILSKQMFSQCNSLSNVEFNISGELLFSGPKPFEGCQKLSTITMPYCVSSYYHLDGETLKGSNILSIFCPGMSKEEAIFAIGGKEKKQSKIDFVTELDEIGVQVGRVYEVKSNLDGERIYISAIKNNVPLYIVRCVVGCSYCDQFHKNIISTPVFQDWLAEFNKCAVIYSSIEYSHSRNYGWGNVGQATICPEEKLSFQFNNKTCFVDHFPNTNLESEIFIDEQTYIPQIRIVTDDDKKQILRVEKVSDIVNLMKTRDFFNDKYYSENDTMSMMCDTGWLDFGRWVFPSFGYYWSNAFNPISNRYIKLSEKEKELFLNGISFNKTYYGFNKVDGLAHRSTNTLYIDFLTRKQAVGRKGSQCVTINNEIRYFTATHGVDWHGDGNQSRYNSGSKDIAIQNDEIYIHCYCTWSGHGAYPQNIQELLPSDDQSLPAFQQAIENWCNWIGSLEQQVDPPKKETFIVYGNCWGVEHDCVVIDKDGEQHQFIYNKEEKENKNDK